MKTKYSDFLLEADESDTGNSKTVDSQNDTVVTNFDTKKFEFDYTQTKNSLTSVWKTSAEPKTETETNAEHTTTPPKAETVAGKPINVETPEIKNLKDKIIELEDKLLTIEKGILRKNTKSQKIASDQTKKEISLLQAKVKKLTDEWIEKQKTKEQT